MNDTSHSRPAWQYDVQYDIGEMMPAWQYDVYYGIFEINPCIFTVGFISRFGCCIFFEYTIYKVL